MTELAATFILTEIGSYMSILDGLNILHHGLDSPLLIIEANTSLAGLKRNPDKIMCNKNSVHK